MIGAPQCRGGAGAAQASASAANPRHLSNLTYVIGKSAHVFAQSRPGRGREGRVLAATTIVIFLFNKGFSTIPPS